MLLSKEQASTSRHHTSKDLNLSLGDDNFSNIRYFFLIFTIRPNQSTPANSLIVVSMDADPQLIGIGRLLKSMIFQNLNLFLERFRTDISNTNISILFARSGMQIVAFNNTFLIMIRHGVSLNKKPD